MGTRSRSTPRVVLAHDWLTGMRGGERVLEELCRLFPDAPLLTLVHVKGSVSPRIEDRPIHVSPLNRWPGIARSYRRFLPLMPAATRALRVPPCDVLLSSSHCAVKALRPPPGARHLCYLHTPMRYAWDQSGAYFGRGRAGLATRLAAGAVLPLLRRWDVATATRVDRFVCNSAFVAARARRIYGRSAEVIHPPVDLARFTVPPAAAGADAPYLMVTAFAPYKGIEIALEAFRRLGRRLDVIGGGQLFGRLSTRFGAGLRALGPLGDAEVARAYRGCRAFVQPAVEDFGITALEAQASGRPVIALAEGGALETVAPLGGAAPPTGVLYARSGDAAGDLAAAVLRFEASSAVFQPAAARAQAERFSGEVFRTQMESAVASLLADSPRRV